MTVFIMSIYLQREGFDEAVDFFDGIKKMQKLRKKD